MAESAVVERGTGGASSPAQAQAPAVVLVAHRAGNAVADAAAAPAAADAIELDVHLFRGRLEVRHAKVLWPFGARWDRWELIPRSTARPTLADILRSVDPDTHLWLDLKGFSSRLTPRVVAEIANRPVTVSSRSWWILRSAVDVGNVRVVHSIGSRLQLWALSRRRRRIDAVAIDQRLVHAASLRTIRRTASTVLVWGVRDAERGIALVDAGVDGLIVDGASVLEQIRARLAAGAAPGAHGVVSNPPLTDDLTCP